jgi:hypothetical protein
MEWQKASKTEDATLIPFNWIHIHYYEALNTLFRLENSLRVFVYIVLKNHLFDNWSTINITSDDANQGSMASIAKGRRNQARDFGYLCYDINCPVMYLTSGELIRIITDDGYWSKYFNSYFPASKQMVKNKLDEIGVIRNSLAHFRPLKPDDVEVIKNNANHALSEVDHFLEQLGRCFYVVPTNTQDDWYLSLSPLTTESCKLTLKQCQTQTWMNLQFDYNCKIIATRFSSLTYGLFTILNIITPSILKQYGNITKYATCLTEEVASNDNYTPRKPSFSKSFSMLFTRDVIRDHYQDIRNDIELMLNTIDKETELISSDNLATGYRSVLGYERNQQWKKQDYTFIAVSIQLELVRCVHSTSICAMANGKISMTRCEYSLTVGRSQTTVMAIMSHQKGINTS